VTDQRDVENVDQYETRNLLEGWCPEGEAWTDAVQRVTAAEWERITHDFPLSKPSEQAAALSLYSFTGLIPTNQDDQGGGGQGYDGAVDVLLTDATTGERQVMEVTSSLDPVYQGASRAAEDFERIIRLTYTGTMTWTLGLERGWEFQRLKKLAPIIARMLNDLDGPVDGSEEEIELRPNVTARRLGITDPPIVYVDSRNAGASSFEDTYLDALSAYLANDPTIDGKLEKLEREGPRFEATRRHLYIGMASTGRQGGLLPSSPSYFTWGNFTPPTILDDLWLDGGTGELYHWAREAGWVFHRMS